MPVHDKFVIIDYDLCDLCGTCVGVCPENVIYLSAHQLSIEHDGCTRCNKCIWVCPVRALELSSAKDIVHNVTP